MTIPNNRNSAGAANMAFNVLGVICAITGIYLATITRLYLFTGQTTHPYLAVGILLLMVGIVAVSVTQVAAKRRLMK